MRRLLWTSVPYSLGMTQFASFRLTAYRRSRGKPRCWLWIMSYFTESYTSAGLTQNVFLQKYVFFFEMISVENTNLSTKVDDCDSG